jgi:8-oxo-dGTP pyrophosphatase MutT (NUDIX family)
VCNPQPKPGAKPTNPTYDGTLPPEVSAALDTHIGYELARFNGLCWTDSTVIAWARPTFRLDLPVTSACCLAVTPSRSLVLVNVATRGWDLPGGHLEADESPLEALHRELLEEAGLDVDSTQAILLGMLLVTDPVTEKPNSQMAVYHIELDHEPTLIPQAPGEIHSVDMFPVTALPGQTESLVWRPYVSLL